MLSIDNGMISEENPRMPDYARPEVPLGTEWLAEHHGSPNI
jgi:hypothetical protein